jgi:hypothetical protein
MEKPASLRPFHYLAIVLLVTGVASLFFIKKTEDKIAPVTQMTGHIVEVKHNEIIIEGGVGQETKLIELIITPETVLTKDTIVITDEQARSGKPFAPEIKTLPGQVSELTQDILVRVKTAEDLQGTDRLEASEINYTTYDYPF